ncbi:mechanosensitive ion channel family protein [Parvularcula lutaonensis]|uniref:Mechanosensitive ion channel family protein n=1 Tax=Parvularcula lutaonensis TaxID=491923 RepID=A0ABV7M924_9PROT|nr:mechanosensitive ion channel domain-containing protein [Parvularcula lutaonensis]GGY46004.1 mechanosensitive ion channel protein [Parvularcula lutaonensis]
MQDQQPSDNENQGPEGESLPPVPEQKPEDTAEAMQETSAGADQDSISVVDAANDAADRAVQRAQEATEDGSALAELVDVGMVQRWIGDFVLWSRTELLTVHSAVQLALVFGALIPAVMFGPRLKDFIKRHLQKRLPAGLPQRVADAVATLATPIAAFLALTLFAAILSDGLDMPDQFVDAAQSLLAAWIVVRLVTLAIRSPFWSKVAFYVAWPIAALDAFGVLGDVFDWMRAVSLVISPATEDRGAVELTLYDVLRAAIIFAVFFQLARLFSSVIVNQVQQTDEINPSLKALIAKVINFITPVIALILALQIIGFNLASLAIFSGAVGLGIGLGLQKIIGNFLAGFTLLADKSIKPGDTIEIGDTFGWITEMKSRYVSIRTRDGTEHLIPNSQFIEGGVINWSHNDRNVRCHAPFGVAYGTKDLRLVQKIAIEAALSQPRVQETPKPVCNLMEFGDNSVNFDLRFWIVDPPNGIANVRSEIYFKIWEGLAAENIEIPFPQRDLHIRSSDVPLFPDAGQDTGV